MDHYSDNHSSSSRSRSSTPDNLHKNKEKTEQKMRTTIVLKLKTGKLFVAGILVVVTDIIKPRLNVSEVFHRLAPIEGQKELARRLESRAEKMEVTK